jgi:hypothetical protein
MTSPFVPSPFLLPHYAPSSLAFCLRSAMAAGSRLAPASRDLGMGCDARRQCLSDEIRRGGSASASRPVNEDGHPHPPPALSPLLSSAGLCTGQVPNRTSLGLPSALEGPLSEQSRTRLSADIAAIANTARQLLAQRRLKPLSPAPPSLNPGPLATGPRLLPLRPFSSLPIHVARAPATHGGVLCSTTRRPVEHSAQPSLPLDRL